MITIMQGASKKITVTLKSDQLVVQDPETPLNIMLEIYPETSNKVLNIYGTDETFMDTYVPLNYPANTSYSLGVINGGADTVDFFIEAEHTASWPLGRMVGKFTITYEDQYFEGNRVIKARAAMFNVIL